MTNTPIFIIDTINKGVRPNNHISVAYSKFIDNKFLFQKQIEIIRSIYHNAKVIFIVNSNSEKIISYRKIDNFDYIVLNKSLTNTLAITIQKFDIWNGFYFINGDLFFNKEILQQISPINLYNDISYFVINKARHRKTIGIGPNNEFDYSFEDKWAKIAYIEPSMLFKWLCCHHPYKIMHEILGELSSSNWPFKKVYADNNILIVSKNKDIKHINGLITTTNK